jgi:hypothetical protein
LSHPGFSVLVIKEYINNIFGMDMHIQHIHAHACVGWTEVTEQIQQASPKMRIKKLAGYARMQMDKQNIYGRINRNLNEKHEYERILMDNHHG